MRGTKSRNLPKKELLQRGGTLLQIPRKKGYRKETGSSNKKKKNIKRPK